jgi:peptidoglycan/LPS O-acetylase OafA/YrhL
MGSSESQSRYLPSLDGLRAVSIILVVLSHAVTFTAPVEWRRLQLIIDGPLGVRIFFVISGFLITTLLLREQDEGSISLPHFYLRRLLRLAPVQLAYIAVVFLLTQTTALQLTACEFLTAITYTKNYACGASWIDGHLWSLSVEEQFYLLWPTLLALLPRRSWLWVLTALIVVSPASRAIQYQLGLLRIDWLTSNSDVLMLGCFTALLVRSPAALRLLERGPTAGRLAALVVILVPMSLRANYGDGWFTIMLGPTLQAVAIAYLIASLVHVRRGWSYTALNSRPMTFLGRMSYSLYIWQQPFFARPGSFGLAWALPMQFPWNIPLSFAAGLASYLLIEKPLARVRARFSARRPRGLVLA